MKASEVTEPGAYWLWPNADWFYDSWMPLWVEEQCGRLAFYPATFDYDIDPRRADWRCSRPHRAACRMTVLALYGWRLA